MRKQKRPATPPPFEDVDDPLAVAADAVRRARKALELQESAVAGLREADAHFRGVAQQVRQAPQPAPIRLTSALFGALLGPAAAFDRAALRAAHAALAKAPEEHRARTLDDLIESLTGLPSDMLERQDLLDPQAFVVAALRVKDVREAEREGLVQRAELQELVSAAVPEDRRRREEGAGRGPGSVRAPR